MDISEAINQLNELKYPYPTEAVRYVREHKDEAVPALMMNIQRQLDELPNESPSTLDTILSYYLLAEFRIKEALPLLLRPLRLDEKALDYVLGDIVFDGYGGIIASCADAADLPLIEAIVLDESVSKYARDAALTSLNVLYAEGDLSRDALAGVYRRLLDSLLKHDSDDDDEPFLLPSAVNNTANLHLDEFYDDAKAMFDKFGSSDFFGEWEDWLSKYNASASDAKAAYLSNSGGNHYITDTVESTERWAVFKESEILDTSPEFEQQWKAAKAEVEAEMSTYLSRPTPAPNTYDGVKVGRNDPCPCGSGKKFKKCHGAVA